MTEYEEILEKAIQKESEIIGDRAVEIAREKGIKVDDDGKVESFQGIGKQKLKKIVNEYSEIGGDITPSLIARELKGLDTSDVRLPKKLKEKV